MKTQCPQCSKPIEVPDIYEGREVKCESCKTAFFARNQHIIINPEPQFEPPPQPVEELLSLPSSKFPYTITAICLVFSVLSLLWAIVIFCMAFSPNYGDIDELMKSARKTFGISVDSLLVAALFYSLAAIIDAINANTKRKK